MLRGRQILPKDRGKDRIEDDSPLWNSTSGEQHDLGQVVIPRRENLCRVRFVEHFIGKNLSHVTVTDGLAGQ